MSRILLQTTIPEHPDDWDITRFSLLADELRAAGHEVIARNRANRGDDDPILSNIAMWLQAPTSRHTQEDRYDQRVPAHH